MRSEAKDRRQTTDDRRQRTERNQKSEVGGQKAKSIEHERLKISDFRFQIDLKKNRRSDRSREVPL